jgi:hypothetical protein
MRILEKDDAWRVGMGKSFVAGVHREVGVSRSMAAS